MNVSEVDFTEILLIALPKLSMYVESTEIDYQGIIQNVEQYNGESVETTYAFSDQIISDKNFQQFYVPLWCK